MKKTYFAWGTHCKSCQILLERHVGTVPGVSRVRANFHTGAIQVEGDNRITDQLVNEAIRLAGYEVGRGAKASWLNKDGEVWGEILVAGCLVFSVWLFASVIGLTSVAQRAQSGTGAVGALVAGLVAGISTCMALVGGLVLSISARHAQRHPEASAVQKFRPHLFFNGGRIASFAILGGLLGGIGSFVQLSVRADGLLIAFAGVVMLMLGISLTGISPRLGSGMTLPAWISRRLGISEDVKEYSHRGAIFGGAVTFFLPCGFTQAVQVAAVASGSFWNGFLIMSAFAVGTAPGLLGIGGISSLMKGAGGRLFFRFVGVVVLVLGLWNISNGWNLTGIALFSNTTKSPSVNQAQVIPIENGFQVVRMNQWAGGYGPNQFTIRRGIPVRWEVTSQDQYSCASTLTIPSMGIRKNLSSGLNVIEFTPTKAGTLRFACGMGMFPGSFTVIDE